MNTRRPSLTSALILTLVVASNAMAQQAPTERAAEPAAAASRSCVVESGMSVCRDVEPGEVPLVKEEKQKEEAATATATAPKGRLLLLLDIPRDIFTRLADDPAKNREYHAKQSWDYRPSPPAPQGADQYKPVLINGQAPWKYTPKNSFAYTPKRDWSYNRDVFGRIWRQNIQHDTQVVSIPINRRGTYLMPVAPIR